MTDDEIRADVEWGTTPSLVRGAAARHGDAEAVVDGDVRLTFVDLSDRVDGAARAFVAAGLQPGDRVGVWAPNCWEWVVTLLGVHAAGGVVVPLNTRYKGGEAAWILDRSRARFLVTVAGFLGNGYVGMLAGQELPHLEQTIVIRDEAPAGAVGWDHFLASGGRSDDAEVGQRREALSSDALSDIIFTSGTTGRPKGVETTHGQTLRTFGIWSDVVGLAAGDRYLIVNPFFHTFGYKAGIIACLLTGATMVPVPVFDPEAVMRTIDAEDISVLPGPPALYQTILNHPDRAQMDSSRLRLAVTGAAPVPVSLVERMRNDLGFDTVLTAYGLTEATGVVSMCRADYDAETISTTSGRAIPGVEVRIVGEDGAEASRGTPGEIVVRGFNVMKGYFEDPEKTAEAIDPDGWLHTGDVGVMDERGYVDITDRTKDMFICGGFNAYPAEIESILSEHPAVAQAAVVGVPDERMGEVGFAWLVPAAGVDPPDEAEVVAWSRETMANFKAPRHVRWTEALPLNPIGKIQKFLLRDDAVAALSAPPTGDHP
ncbi:FadD3 family acyl-CoA ligase [soil metagenome]